MTRFRLAVVTVFGVWLLSGPSGSAFALPPGDLDPSFGTNGRVTTSFGGVESARAVLVQADGKIVVGGTRDIAENLDFALARYNADGSPDLSFGENGRVTTEFGRDDKLIALLQQPDGKLIAAGSDPFHITLARYLPDGSPDPSFGPTNGKVTTTCAYQCRAAALARQSDGKILVAGAVAGPAPGQYDFLLIRYQSGGALDSTFGTGGIVTTDFPAGRQDNAQAVVVQTDGKIVVGGYVVNAIHELDAVLARYELDGSLDASFGSGGLVVEDLSSFDYFFDLALLGDGTIVASGYLMGGSKLLRYLADGTLDPSFATGGIADLPVSGYPTSLIVESTGDFVVAIEMAGAVAITRLTSEGIVDTSFASRGKLDPELLGDYLDLGGVDLAVGPNDRLVVAGAFLAAPTHFTVARYGGGRILRCAPSPQPGCKTPLAARRSQLRFERKHGIEKLKWRWRNGDATTLADLGDPTTADDYALCMYDESTDPPTLALETLAPAAGLCGGSPCWRAKGNTKFTYGDKSATPLGLTALSLKQGGAGRSEVSINAAGPNLSTLPLPAPLPLRLQLQATTGTCWEAVFSLAGATHPEYSTIFRGKSD